MFQVPAVIKDSGGGVSLRLPFSRCLVLLLINYIIKDTIPCDLYTESSESTIDRDSSFIPGSPNPKHHT